MATTAATRPDPRPRSDQEARTDAIDRLLRDRARQGLTRRVSDPVVVAKLAAALKNGNGHLTAGQQRRLVRDLARPPNRNASDALMRNGASQEHRSR